MPRRPPTQKPRSDGRVSTVWLTKYRASGSRALAQVGDVGNKDDAERMVADAIANFGKVDILVNNAAAPHGPDRDWTWKVSEEAWNEVFRVNTKGTFLMSTAVVRHLLERQAPGRIINIASTAGRHGLPQRAAYSASKFAIIGLTQAMAGELAANGITVNAICAGAMDTARGWPARPGPPRTRSSFFLQRHLWAGWGPRRTSAERLCSWPSQRRASSPGSRCS